MIDKKKHYLYIPEAEKSVLKEILQVLVSASYADMGTWVQSPGIHVRRLELLPCACNSTAREVDQEEF